MNSIILRVCRSDAEYWQPHWFFFLALYSFMDIKVLGAFKNVTATYRHITQQCQIQWTTILPLRAPSTPNITYHKQFCATTYLLYP